MLEETGTAKPTKRQADKKRKIIAPSNASLNQRSKQPSNFSRVTSNLGARVLRWNQEPELQRRNSKVICQELKTH